MFEQVLTFPQVHNASGLNLAHFKGTRTRKIQKHRQSDDSIVKRDFILITVCLNFPNNICQTIFLMLVNPLNCLTFQIKFIYKFMTILR
uniref:Uncharacterized protein n=1 Tax=Tetranychus urticae TaxID=32264 RepID=T1L0F7_TETUR